MRIDLKGGGGETRHRKAADRCDQHQQALEPYRLFRGGIAFVAQALVGGNFARHGNAGAWCASAKVEGLRSAVERQWPELALKRPLRKTQG
jgi:hypothetical protein